MENKTNKYNTERLSLSQKDANSKEWYKRKADDLDKSHTDLDIGYDGVSRRRKKKVNYDLFNNKLNLKDFEYVCQPFGSESGELPAKMENRDISSSKIKAIMGMEIKRPFTWNVIAVNPEATTRKEQEEFGRIRDWVIGEIVRPIRQEAEMKAAQEAKGRELTREEQEQIQAQIEEEIAAKTPDETRKYMQREHQDIAEVLHQQLLQYVVQKCDVRRKFNVAFKHALLSAEGIMYVGILNGEPELWNINSLDFNYSSIPGLEDVKDAEEASCEYRMTPSTVVRYFGSELTKKNIDDLYSVNKTGSYNDRIERWLDDDSDTGSSFYLKDESNTVRVLHTVWKSLRKIGFLTYTDEDGEVQEMIVDENYKENKEAGDINIDWEWIPECYETWKIKDDIYVQMRPIPGQFKDLDNLYKCNLPYYGAIYDNMNSEPTSLMDRLKIFQYYYNIIMYRLELLIASDKGKKVLMNIGAIPSSAGMDMKKWQYFMESTPYMWYDPQEEGNTYADANTIAKVIDLSVASDMNKYIEIAEYLRTQAGRSVGITDAVEGQIGPNDAVSNTNQNLIQSSHILEWYFDTHSHTKRNVLQALIETAKVAYSNSNKKKLTYFLDDLTKQTINLDTGLLDSETVGVFLVSSSKAEETKDTIRQLAHAAMQTQSAKLSDIVSMIRQESIVEMEETLLAAEQEAAERESKMQQATLKAQAEEAERGREFRREEFAMEINRDKKKEEEKRKTVLAQAALTGMSFNPDADSDGDGENDFFEIAKHGLNVEIQRDKIQLDKDKFNQSKMVDNEKLKLE